ncbi:tol-pal system-associated acyl-CoA thioesterase [Caldimonas thermodepolymerans]|jgi:acyl-CoA thioester hydrolase|uniref:(3S)-malyl-CoA thioesterase n=1 Tax=Caldimonas thermodepolymerans TaxID=215580 RepID=A0A2S5T9F4_9BURK|nr:tol-pal system-associated acyl-CoA thioesterase [Caldimonas thermodepolymerans]PPE71613.1 tol-pal system-associated acyl-CoA thioesterase [Caldimonas thermodepolymerans]QPC30638.1 tol-pal system-associated acyl-CoA thioesterase [Caldimonas thermodepolymerans]RDI02756.1 (3S)-malyl-CoA thioesterase [Caldimonas thermodepolymerans]TCP08714.1 (3S)-malyl-CoA thioesterase [Caldimonas thermodepolymerans]UZG47039.1 tol-pal system-associated acyl-CoA thioesterase [Caldimonas thermodepolymerans]
MSDDRLSRPARPFVFPVRVYWEDTDAGGVVFYANYLKFFERARTEWLRALGHSQERMRREAGVMFVVVHTEVKYLAPARLDDLLHVTVQVREAGKAALVIAQEAWRDGTLLAQGDIKIGCVDASTFRPRRIPAGILQETTT